MQHVLKPPGRDEIVMMSPAREAAHLGTELIMLARAGCASQDLMLTGGGMPAQVLHAQIRSLEQHCEDAEELGARLGQQLQETRAVQQSHPAAGAGGGCEPARTWPAMQDGNAGAARQDTAGGAVRERCHLMLSQNGLRQLRGLLAVAPASLSTNAAKTSSSWVRSLSWSTRQMLRSNNSPNLLSLEVLVASAGPAALHDTRPRQRPSSGGTSAVTDGLLSWAMRRRSDTAAHEPDLGGTRSSDHAVAGQIQARAVVF